MTARVLPARVFLSRQAFLHTVLLSIIVLACLIPARPAAHATAAGSISGRVTSSNGGGALQGTRLRIYDLNNDTFILGAVTDANGDYSWPVPAGTYTVLTDDTHGHINEIWNDVKCSTTCNTNNVTFFDVSNSPVTGIDFVLDPGARVAGTVTS